MDARLTLLLEMIDQAYDHRAWHGTNLKGSLRGIQVKTALWRPGPGRHCIWDIIVHAAYWKFCVRRHVTGLRQEKFPRQGSDWFRLPSAEPTHLKADLALLGDQHKKLREAVALFPASRLKSRPDGLKWRYEQYIYGIASHDLYHAGQVQLLKRLQKQG